MDTCIVFVIWLLYSMYEGIREGYYFAVKIDSKKLRNLNEHELFTSQRAMVLFLCILLLSENLWDVLMYAFMLSLSFPFIHDGSYYKTRHEVDGAYKGWFDHSTTSTAKLTRYLTPVNRTLMFVMSLIILILSLFV